MNKFGETLPQETDISDTRTRTDIEPILKEIVEALVRDYQPELIILYGSYAYGTPTRHSEIDLFIVKETALQWVDRFVEVKEILFNPTRGIAVSPNVLTPAELDERLKMHDSFVEEIYNEGKRLYERHERKDQRRRTSRVV